MRRPGRVRLLGAVAVLTALVSCGVPQDGATRTVRAEDVPYGLLQPGGDPSPVPTEEAPATSPMVYFTDPEDRLVAQHVPVDVVGLGPMVAALLERLAAGPDEQQRRRGLGSALGPGVGLRLVHVVEGIAYVEVATPEQSPAADQLPLAIGQVVLTVTSVDGVELALLLRDGRPLEAPLPGGERTSRPLSPDDYSVLVPPSSAPTIDVVTGSASASPSLAG